MDVDPSIFKAYDIRGVYPDQLDESVARALGRAFVTLLNTDHVVVGRDMRTSGPALFAALVEGLTQQGAEVTDLGMVSTDQYYHACSTLEAAGMMVTASHNPPQYNGFKMVRRMPYLLSGDEGIQDLLKLVRAGSFPASSPGRVVPRSFKESFVTKVLSLIDLQSLRNLKVMADTANGMVGPILKAVFAHLPVELEGMYLEPDGRVPNHGLDPLMPENRAELERRVVEEGADVGFAFDGDGDRFFVIDDGGSFVSGDFLTALLGEYLLEGRAAAKVVYDLRASWAVPDRITAAGGIPLVERVGHSFMKARMVKEGAIFGGEVTGHYYFQDFFNADSGVVPALFVLEMLSKKGKPLSELLAPLEEKYFISGEINSTADDVNATLKALVARYKDGRISDLDGVSVEYEDWHFNVRPSNTEPLLRLNLEAKSRAAMEARRDEVLGLIRS